MKKITIYNLFACPSSSCSSVVLYTWPNSWLLHTVIADSFISVFVIIIKFTPLTWTITISFFTFLVFTFFFLIIFLFTFLITTYISTLLVLFNFFLKSAFFLVLLQTASIFSFLSFVFILMITVISLLILDKISIDRVIRNSSKEN